MAQNDKTKLIDVKVPIPGKEGEFFSIELSTRVMKQARKIIDELLVSRRIPFDQDAISIGDPLALIIAHQKTHLDGNEAVHEASETYKRWAREAQGDAFMVAMTMYNELHNTPTPYEREQDEHDDIPNWMKS